MVMDYKDTQKFQSILLLDLKILIKFDFTFNLMIIIYDIKIF